MSRSVLLEISRHLQLYRIRLHRLVPQLGLSAKFVQHTVPVKTPQLLFQWYKGDIGVTCLFKVFCTAEDWKKKKEKYFSTA